MRTLSIALQQHIHGTCQELSSKLKQLNLKLKEIKTVENKIFQLKPGFVKKSMKKIKSKSQKLKAALKKEKKIVKKVLRSLKQKEKKILKVLSVYDKNFMKKNSKALNKMISTINISLQTYMKYSFFKKVYQKFINHFLNKVKGFNKNHFKDPDTTARNFVKKYWNNFFAKEKKKFDHEQAKKKLEKRKKSKKYYNKK
jgi:hypothetical protein